LKRHSRVQGRKTPKARPRTLKSRSRIDGTQEGPGDAKTIVMVVLKKSFFPVKGEIRGKRGRKTKGEVKSQVNRDVEVEEMLDARHEQS